MKKYVATLPRKTPYPLAAIFYDDPGDLIDENTMRVSAGFIVKVKNDGVDEYFKKLGYESKLLPSGKAVGVLFPIVCSWSVQFWVASFKSYPAMFNHIEGNQQKYIKMLSGQRTVCMEIYNIPMGKVNFYMPMEKAKEFYLTKAPEPKLKSIKET